MSHLNPTQTDELRRIIADAVASAMAGYQLVTPKTLNQTIKEEVRRALQDRRGPAGDCPAPDWTDEEVGLFYPDCPDSNQVLTGDGNMVTTTNGQIMYRNVYLFIERRKDAASYRGEALVKERIPALLRGSAQMWYSTALDSLERTGLRHEPIQAWYDKLTTRFRRPMEETFAQRCHQASQASYHFQ